MKTFRALAVIGALVACSIALLGSWTRINQAGMTCPDWPLCHGAVVPILHGGVVLEWLHRLLAGIETFVVAVLIALGWPLRIRLLRGLLIALGAIFVLQVLLGGATIFLANSPLSVMIHWGTAMVLLAILSSIVVVAFSYNSRQPDLTFTGRGTAVLFLVVGCAWVTMCLGAYVSSSGAGLACPSVPGCGLAVLGVPQELQMTHRVLAGVLVLSVLAAAVLRPKTSSRSTIAFYCAGTLLTLQIVLGILNVLWLLPTGLREAHAANAVATFLAFIVATVFASLDGYQAVPDSMHARQALRERAFDGS